ncbi:MAG TPA: polysaccharide deacetylase family protein [Candidatus Saccharimonadales bacterium]|nr:polysaccharide deacetylase family protein [Candidatus Saccharimonadales bacterium]
MVKKKHSPPKTPPRRKLVRRLIRNPIIAIFPIVVLLWCGWQYYLSGSRHINAAAHNLLPGGNMHIKHGSSLPDGWQLKKEGALQASSASVEGYAHGRAVDVHVGQYLSGDVALETPKVTLSPKTTYLFKGYYVTTGPFTLLVRYFYQNGTSRLETIQQYPAQNDPWSTVSHAFTSGGDITAVQFVYRMSANGDVKIGATYLASKNDHLYIAPQPNLPQNLLANSSLAAPDPDQTDSPQYWTHYQSGANQSTFAYSHAQQGSSLRSEVHDYKGGEAKWQFYPLTVQAGQSFWFSVDYQSTSPVELTAEYELANGNRQYDTARTLDPAGDWTHTTAQFEVPAGATNMFVSLVQHHNGTLATKNYYLGEITRPGPRRFAHPLVSVTFDDGWQSSYYNGARLLDQYGYKGTYYLNSSTIDTGIFMSKPQLLDLQRRGHQLAAHGDEHVDMTSISGPQIDVELKRTAEYLTQLHVQHADFATPYGKSDAEVQAYARAYYQSHRGTDDGLNTKQNFDPYNLKVVFITKDTPAQTISEALANAAEYNGWLILVYHRIEDKVISSTTITPATFTTHLELIKKSGIPVASVGQAFSELSSQ